MLEHRTDGKENEMEWMRIPKYGGVRICPICKEPFTKTEVIERFKCCPCCGIFLELSEEDKKEKMKGE